MNTISTLSGLLLLIFLYLPIAKADGRALLISLSEYQHPTAFSPGIQNLNLPGVDHDIKKMLASTQQLGIALEDTLILSNASATEKNIKWAIRNHFIGMPDTSRALIYFSGHGTIVWDENGDEDDNTDEVLLAYDTKFVKSGEQYELQGRIIDDEIDELLAQIPSKRVLFIVDACHSGNINKSMTSHLIPTGAAKYAKNPHLINDPRYQAYINDDMTSSTKGLWDTITHRLGLDAPPDTNGHVFLTATGASGKAISLPEGSAFTSHLNRAMNLLTEDDIKHRINLKGLRQTINEAIGNQFPQTDGEPQLFGDSQLIEQGY